MPKNEPTDKEIILLKQFALLHFATIDQIMYSAGIDYANLTWRAKEAKRLQSLVIKGYLRQIEPSREGKTGKQKLIYHLSDDGRKCLSDLDIETSAHTEPPNQILRHVLAINDVLVLAIRFSSLWRNIKIAEIIHDYDLHKIKDLAVYPDAYIHFLIEHGGKTYHAPLFIEVDTGTETQATKIQGKIDGYNTLFTTNFYEKFKVSYISIVWFTTAGELRLRNLQQTIEQKLSALNMEENGECFYLTRLLPDLDPTSLFTAPQFFMPYKGSALHSLLDIVNPPP